MHAHARVCARVHTHTHPVQTDRGEGQCCLTEIFLEEEYPEFAFEGRESSRELDVLQDIFLYFIFWRYGLPLTHTQNLKKSKNRSPSTGSQPRSG